MPSILENEPPLPPGIVQVSDSVLGDSLSALGGQACSPAQYPQVWSSLCADSRPCSMPEQELLRVCTEQATLRTGPPDVTGARFPHRLFVNSEIRGSGRPVRCPKRLLSHQGIRRDQKLYLRQLIGPPRFKVPWYTAPPYEGTYLHRGFDAGAVLGPVVTYVYVGSMPFKPGFLSCCIETPSREGLLANAPDHVWVNAWCTHNKNGQPVGISYCELFFVNDEGVWCSA